MTPPIYRDPGFRRLWTVGLLSSLIRWLEILVFGVFTYQQTQSAGWVASMTMLRMLRECLAPAEVQAADTLGWASDAIEAQAFGFDARPQVC